MGTWPHSSSTFENGAPPLQLNSTTPVCPSRETSEALSCSAVAASFSPESKLSRSSFQRLALPITHFQRQLSVAAKFLSYSAGVSGSRQNISMWAPVGRRKNRRAGTTLVSLKIIIASEGSSSGMLRNTLSRTSPSLYMRSLEESRSARGYFAILSSGSP